MKPCDVIINCPCSGSPLMGVDAMAADPPEFVATGYQAVVPNLGNSDWIRLECMKFAESTTSEADAQATANRDALLCALGALSPYIQPPGSSGGGGGGTIFFSNEASCTVNCPDGLPFTYSVAAGAFVSNSSQADADAKAQSAACAQAAQRVVCLSALSPSTYTVGSPYSGTISATGGFSGPGNIWQVTSGSLPPGLTLTGAGSTATISGTPTTGGVYAFNVTVTDSQGDTMTKSYTLQCATAFSIVTNVYPNVFSPTNVGFVSTSPDAPYDTKYQTAQPAPQTNGGNYIKINFTSPTSKTWNLKANVSIIGGTCFAYLKIDGVQQVLTVSGTNATFVGSFNSTSCTTPTVIEMDVGPANGATATGYLEWQTPP